MVVVTGLAGSRPCVWLLSRFQLEKTATVTLLLTVSCGRAKN